MPLDASDEGGVEAGANVPRRARSRRCRCRTSRRAARRSGGASPRAPTGRASRCARTAACTRAVTSFDASGDHGAPPDDLPAGRRSSGASTGPLAGAVGAATSATWELVVPPGSAPRVDGVGRDARRERRRLRRRRRRRLRHLHRHAARLRPRRRPEGTVPVALVGPVGRSAASSATQPASRARATSTATASPICSSALPTRTPCTSTAGARRASPIRRRRCSPARPSRASARRSAAQATSTATGTPTSSWGCPAAPPGSPVAGVGRDRLLRRPGRPVAVAQRHARAAVRARTRRASALFVSAAGDVDGDGAADVAVWGGIETTDPQYVLVYLGRDSAVRCRAERAPPVRRNRPLLARQLEPPRVRRATRTATATPTSS